MTWLDSERLTIRALDNLVKRGALTVTLPSGTTVITGGLPGPTADIEILDDVALRRRVLRSGSVGFAEAYIDNEWDTSDLAQLLELAARNNDHRRRTRAGSAAMWWARAAWGRLTGAPSGPAVEEMVDHYDLGNEFYAAWLDESMTYSSAIFEADDDLFHAQLRKYERIARLADIRPGHRVLEIGCGWGSMAEYLADERGASVTALTISQEQHDFVTARIAANGLDDRVDVVLADFREVGGDFDRVVSIEMIESIDELQWPDLCDAIAQRLVPGGVAGLQVITIDHDLHEEMRGRNEFIRSYIFPGGALPSVRNLRELGEDSGLEWLRYASHGVSYAVTLANWDERFTKAWPKIRAASAQFDDRFYRMWRYYLAYCEAGFRTGRLDGIQVAYRKPQAV